MRWHKCAWISGIQCMFISTKFLKFNRAILLRIIYKLWTYKRIFIPWTHFPLLKVLSESNINRVLCAWEKNIALLNFMRTIFLVLLSLMVNFDTSVRIKITNSCGVRIDAIYAKGWNRGTESNPVETWLEPQSIDRSDMHKQRKPCTAKQLSSISFSQLTNEIHRKNVNNTRLQSKWMNITDYKWTVIQLKWKIIHFSTNSLKIRGPQDKAVKSSTVETCYLQG